jgi:hypothetical protein
VHGPALLLLLLLLLLQVELRGGQGVRGSHIDEISHIAVGYEAVQH